VPGSDCLPLNIYIYMSTYIYVNLYNLIYTLTCSFFVASRNERLFPSIYIYIHVYPYTYTFIYVYIPLYVPWPADLSSFHIHIYVYPYTYILIYTYLCTLKHTYTYTHICVPLYIHVHIPLYVPLPPHLTSLHDRAHPVPNRVGQKPNSLSLSLSLPIYVYTHICTPMHIYKHIYPYIHLYMLILRRFTIRQIQFQIKFGGTQSSPSLSFSVALSLYVYTSILPL